MNMTIRGFVDAPLANEVIVLHLPHGNVTAELLAAKKITFYGGDCALESVMSPCLHQLGWP